MVNSVRVLLVHCLSLHHIVIKKMMSVCLSVCPSVHIKSSSAPDHRCKKEQEMSSRHKIFFSPATKYFFLPPLPTKNTRDFHQLAKGPVKLDTELSSLSLCHKNTTESVRLAGHPRGAAPLGVSYSNKEDDVRPSVRPSVRPYQKFFCDGSQMQKGARNELPPQIIFFSLRSQEKETHYDTYKRETQERVRYHP